MARLKLFIPLLVCLGLGLFFYFTLNQISEGEYSPQALPSALLNRPVPDFDLPSLNGEGRISNKDLLGQIALINVWATWCPSCHAEHAYLNQLKQQGIVIHGINYKDNADAARQWLATKGDPYQQNIIDSDGRFGIDLGVTGAPETYVIDHRGFVRMRFQGPLNADVWQQKFAPLLGQLKREQGGL